MKLPPATASQIQRLDRLAIKDYKIPSLRLMETAGEKSARHMLKELKPGAIVAIFCGKGNNGGDGLVIARHLLESGIVPKVFLLSGKSDLKPDAGINFQRFVNSGGRVAEITGLKKLNSIKPQIKNCCLIVDAIFGVGLKGELPRFYQGVIDFLNHAAKSIIAIDVPSGLDATSGMALGNCITASKTISFSLAKKGFYKNDGPRCCGKIKVVGIGIPHKLIRKVLKIRCR